MGIRPHTLTPNGPAVFVFGALTASPDHTAQLVAFFTSSEAAASGAPCTELAVRIAKTLRAGSGALAASSGVRSLYTFSESQELQLTVPDGWVATSQPGPDFIVHRVVELSALDAVPVTIGIYVGDHPTYRATQDHAAVTRTEGTLFGEQVEWHRWTTAGAGEEGAPDHIEAMTRFPDPHGSPAFVHVWESAPDEAALARADAIVQTLRVATLHAAGPSSSPGSAPSPASSSPAPSTPAPSH